LAIQCFVHFQDEKPYNVGADVLYSHYVGKDRAIRGFEVNENRFEVIFETQLYERLIFEPGAQPRVTYRKIIPRRR
jgi:hypothetical protein